MLKPGHQPKPLINGNINQRSVCGHCHGVHEHKGNNVHDKESGIITIHSHHTEWNAHLPMTTMHP